MNVSKKNKKIIKIENISKKYRLGSSVSKLRSLVSTNTSKKTAYEDEFWALKDINFNVYEGEILGMIGKNGAGKSTLLKIISRITKPTTGQITVNGRLSSLLEVGTGFHPELSGRENVFLNGALLGISKSEVTKKFDEIVEFSEIDPKFLNTPVKRYSSGMYVRLAFSVAAHLLTSVIIVDEVLAVGDISFQRKCLGKMEGMSQEGRTIMFVSHNLGSVRALCDRVVLLDQGKMEFIGATEEALEKYMNFSLENDDSAGGKGYAMNRQDLIDTAGEGLEITNIELVNPENPSLGPQTGDPITLQIHYKNDSRWRAPAFVVRIKDTLGYELIRLSTQPISGFDLHELHDKGVVQLHIDSLPLVAGHYFVDVAFARERIEFIHDLRNVVKMEVLENDVYGSGLPLDGARGRFVISHHWQHQKN